MKSNESFSRKYLVDIWNDPKDPFNKRSYYKGQHGASVVRSKSVHAVQLRNKQIIRVHYNLSEYQMRNIAKKAFSSKGNTGDNLISLLESRLATVVYRANFAPTIHNARQIVTHGHVLVNGKKVNIPSYTVKIGDVIEIQNSYRENKIFITATNSGKVIPDYISPGKEASVTISRIPVFAEAPLPKGIDINAVVGYYSKRF